MTTTNDTRTRVLDVAEQMFAENGYDGVSLRALTKSAGVNLAAVNYHFGSKAGLLSALLERHFLPVNAERLADLDKLEAGLPAEVPNVEALLAVFIGVPVRHFAGIGDRAQAVMQLMGKLHSNPHEVIAEQHQAHFAETIQRFSAAFGRALPDLPADQVQFRMMATVGVFSFFLCGPKPPPVRAALAGLSPEELTNQIVAFALRGFQGEPTG